MEACKNIKATDYEIFIRIMKQYLPDSDEDKVTRMYEKYKSTFVGYYLDDTLIGICYGWPRKEVDVKDNSYSIDGITITHPYNAQGRGSKLISYFEQRVKELGYCKTSVGSADGYVEKFYMQNGYEPVEYKVLREDRETYIHRLSSIKDYLNLNRNEILQMTHGYHGFIVFQKAI